MKRERKFQSIRYRYLITLHLSHVNHIIHAVKVYSLRSNVQQRDSPPIEGTSVQNQHHTLHDLLIARPVRDARKFHQQLALLAHGDHIDVLVAAAKAAAAAARQREVIGRRGLGRLQRRHIAAIAASRRVGGRLRCRCRRRRGVHRRPQSRVIVGVVDAPDGRRQRRRRRRLDEGRRARVHSTDEHANQQCVVGATSVFALVALNF